HNRRAEELRASRTKRCRRTKYLRGYSERSARARLRAAAAYSAAYFRGSLPMINALTQTDTDATPEITASEHALVLEDGTELFYRAWIPREPTRKALVIFHRGHEH